MISASVASLKAGDAITLFIDGNFTSGRVVVVQGGYKYVANNDYKSHDNVTGAKKRSERYGYRLLFSLSSSAIKGIKKVALADLPYKTRDILEDECGDQVKILGRSGGVHHLSEEGDFDAVGESLTRSELDARGYTLVQEDEEDEDEEVVEMTVAEVSRKLGKNVKIVK